MQRLVITAYSRDVTGAVNGNNADRIGRSVTVQGAIVAAFRRILTDDNVRRADIYRADGLCVWIISRSQRGGSIVLQACSGRNVWFKK